MITHGRVVLLVLDAAEMRSLLLDHVRYKPMYLQPDVTDCFVFSTRSCMLCVCSSWSSLDVLMTHMKADKDGFIHELIQHLLVYVWVWKGFGLVYLQPR